jgi:heat shock protein HslJ
MTPSAFAAAILLSLSPVSPAGGPIIPVQATEGFEGAAVWEIFELGGRMLITDPLPTLSFVEEGMFSAYAGCNRIAGGFERVGDSLTIPGNMISTRMACPPPLDRLEADLIEGLGQVAGLVSSEGMLALTNEAGVVVMRLRSTE